MSLNLNSCAALGYDYKRSFCLPVNVVVEAEEKTHHPAWIAGAFFLGLVLGVALVFLVIVIAVKPLRSKALMKLEALKSSVRSKLLRRNGEADKNIHLPPQGDLVQGELDQQSSQAMVLVLSRPSSCEAEIEMAQQDVASVISMEKVLEEEKSTMLLHIIMFLLRKYWKEKDKTKESLPSLLDKIRQIIQESRQNIDLKLDSAGERMQQELRVWRQISHELKESACMTEADTSQIMKKLARNMAIVEGIIGMEISRQRKVLHERWAKRKEVLEYLDIESDVRHQDIETRMEILTHCLLVTSASVGRGKGSANDIFNDVAKSWLSIRDNHAREYSTRSLEKYKSLQTSRFSSLSQLGHVHQKAMIEFLQKNSHFTNTLDFIKKYHSLVTKQQMERESLANRLDTLEVQEIIQLRQEMKKQENNDLDEAVLKALEKSKSKMQQPQLTEVYKAEINKYNTATNKERPATIRLLHERLQQRLATDGEADSQIQRELQFLSQGQATVLRKLLMNNIDLNEKDKQEMIREQDQSMQALLNKIVCVRFKLQKSFEVQLHKEKMKSERLKLRKKEQHTLNIIKQKGNDNFIRKMENEIIKEEKLLEEVRQAAVLELRRQVSHETDKLLKLHEEEINCKIGRLQVSEARRQIVPDRQEASAELEKKLEQKLTSANPLHYAEIEKIREKFITDVTKIHANLQLQWEKEDKQISENIKAKISLLEEETEDKLEADVQADYQELRRTRASQASLLQMQLHLEQRHARAVQDIHTEMLALQETLKREHFTDFLIGLQNEFQARQQEFWTKMAALKWQPG